MAKKPQKAKTEKMAEPTNYVELAVAKIGGPVQGAAVMGCSPTSVYKWIRDGRVGVAVAAVRLAKASKIPVQKLVGNLDPRKPDLLAEDSQAFLTELSKRYPESEPKK